MHGLKKLRLTRKVVLSQNNEVKGNRGLLLSVFPYEW